MGNLASVRSLYRSEVQSRIVSATLHTLAWMLSHSHPTCRHALLLPDTLTHAVALAISERARPTPRTNKRPFLLINTPKSCTHLLLTYYLFYTRLKESTRFPSTSKQLNPHLRSSQPHSLTTSYHIAMSIFKNLLAATAIVNVAFAGTAYSSDVASVVTSVQLVTSVTFADPPAASSSTHCNTLTVTEVAPPSTVTVVAPPPGASGTDILESSKSDGMTIQTSIPSSTISKVFGTEPCTHVTSGKAAIAIGCYMPSSSSSNIP